MSNLEQANVGEVVNFANPTNRITGCKLDENNQPVPLYDLMEVASVQADSVKCRVAQTMVGFVYVSAVLLPFNTHNGAEFEVMVFDSPFTHDNPQWRFKTFEDAKGFHDNQVAIISGQISTLCDARWRRVKKKFKVTPFYNKAGRKFYSELKQASHRKNVKQLRAI